MGEGSTSTSSTEERWQDRAACAGKTEMFFVPFGMSGFQAAEWLDPARALCASCPVLEQCRDWAITDPNIDTDDPGFIAGMAKGALRRARGAYNRSRGLVSNGKARAA